MFMLKNNDELMLFIQQNNMKDGVEWNIDQTTKRVSFNSEKKEKKEIPAQKMIYLSLDYATELNRII